MCAHQSSHGIAQYRTQMRPLWKGTLAFGLVSIPVKLYSAVEESELDLDLLDAKDQERIRYQRVNEATGKEVPWERIVRGFKLNGRYVLLEPDEMKRAAPEKSEVITVHDFVNVEEVPGKYYERPYYLEPDKGGAHPYALLREALRKSGHVGIASFVLRTKQHPAVLVPEGSVLILNQIRYAEELRPLTGLKLPSSTTPKPSEMKLAMQLIAKGESEFDIKRYKDDYTAALMKMIRAKSRRKGKAAKGTPMRVVHKKKNEDLMAALKASLEAKTKRKRAS